MINYTPEIEILESFFSFFSISHKAVIANFYRDRDKKGIKQSMLSDQQKHRTFKGKGHRNVEQEHRRTCKHGGFQKREFIRSQSKKVEKYVQGRNLQTAQRDAGGVQSTFLWSEHIRLILLYCITWPAELKGRRCLKLVLLDTDVKNITQHGHVIGNPHRKPSAGCRHKAKVRGSILKLLFKMA